MKVSKEPGKSSGFNISDEIGGRVWSSYWSAPGESIDHAGLRYLSDRYPIIKTEKRAAEFKKQYKGLWQKEDIKHELKTLPKYFKAVKEGIKTFEVRKDDRNYQVGDILILQEYAEGKYLIDTYQVKITYILGRKSDEKMFVPEGYVILGIK